MERILNPHPPQKTEETHGFSTIPFTEADFAKVARWTYERVGIVLAGHKLHMAYRRLLPIVRKKRFSAFADYLHFLEKDGKEADWQEFINALTTNHTGFFREPHHFEHLATYLRSLKTKWVREISLWSAGCSTGEEPYTMAMTALEVFAGKEMPVKILATDIDTGALAFAEAGLYPKDRVIGVSPHRLSRFFEERKKGDEFLYAVRPEVRSLVHFRQFNLLSKTWPMKGPFDAIFCRNVLIYFDRATQNQILANFHRLLAADGYFYAGHAESLYHVRDLFISRGQTIYAPASRGS